MPTPEELEAKLKEVNEQNAKLQEDLKTHQEKLQSIESGDKSVEALQSKMADLEQKYQAAESENAKIKLDLTRQELVKKYPYAAGFTEHITGQKPEELEERAKKFHETVEQQRQEAVKTKEDELKKQWGSIPQGSTPGILNQQDWDAKYEEAKKNGDYSAMLKLKANKILGART